MERVLFGRIGYMKYYGCNGEFDSLEGGGEWARHQRLNFVPRGRQTPGVHRTSRWDEAFIRRAAAYKLGPDRLRSRDVIIRAEGNRGVCGQGQESRPSRCRLV
jgi:hypothetical protein